MGESSQNLGLWIGRDTVSRDLVTEAPLLGLQATLDRREVELPSDGIAPSLAHWLYFLPHEPMRRLGEDGHPLRGGFLPPVSLPRRMWAGGSLAFLRPLRLGARITRRSVVSDVTGKTGRTGRLVFVRVDHEITDEDGLLVRERQDLVYRDRLALGKVAETPPCRPASLDPHWIREVATDARLLFRYSALTFNTHRIHYDLSYAQTIESYPGLVVHGPLIATFLLDELVTQRPDVELESFEFRAVTPAFAPDALLVCGSIQDDTAMLFACNRDGGLHMQASARLRRKAC